MILGRGRFSQNRHGQIFQMATIGAFSCCFGCLGSSIWVPNFPRNHQLQTSLGPFPQDVRHVDHDGRVHVRDVVAGMKAVVYRRATSNSVESSRKLRDEGMAGMTEEYS